MKKLFLTMVITSIFGACASQAPLSKNPQPKEPPRPITILQSKEIAHIDGSTLKVTYENGVDPKLVVDQMVKAWAEALENLRICQDEVKKLKK